MSDIHFQAFGLAVPSSIQLLIKFSMLVSKFTSHVAYIICILFSEGQLKIDHLTLKNFDILISWMQNYFPAAEPLVALNLYIFCGNQDTRTSH